MQIATYVITQQLVNTDCNICHYKSAGKYRLQHMSLQIGWQMQIVSYVITKRLVNADCNICHHKCGC